MTKCCYDKSSIQSQSVVTTYQVFKWSVDMTCQLSKRQSVDMNHQLFLWQNVDMTNQLSRWQSIDMNYLPFLWHSADMTNQLSKWQTVDMNNQLSKW